MSPQWHGKKAGHPSTLLGAAVLANRPRRRPPVKEAKLSRLVGELRIRRAKYQDGTFPLRQLADGDLEHL